MFWVRLIFLNFGDRLFWKRIDFTAFCAVTVRWIDFALEFP